MYSVPSFPARIQAYGAIARGFPGLRPGPQAPRPEVSRTPSEPRLRPTIPALPRIFRAPAPPGPAREIDLQISALAGIEPLWTGAGFSARFALPLPDGTEDWRHAPEQAALVRVNDLALLTDYLDAACALAHEYLDGLEAAALDDVVDRSWDPPVTRAARLVSIIDDAAQHSGQAVYARRLLGLEG